MMLISVQDKGPEGWRGCIRRGIQRSLHPSNDNIWIFISFIGREAATGRKIAIKKIKVGGFKDGLDMSAIREVKHLRELKHQNVIEVRLPRRTWPITDEYSSF